MATIEEPQKTADTLVSLTPTAAAKIAELMAEEPAGEAEVLRIAIQGGGCSGFQYGLGFDRGSQEGDLEFVSEGVTVVVDPWSAPYLQGASVDFLNTITEAGFKIENPNAAASCGCGHSFTVEEGEEGAEGHSHAHAAGGCGSGSCGC